jgi:hypothetical protein
VLNQSRQSLVQTRQSLVDDVMGIDLVRNLVMDYVGMNNWENLHSFSGVCKLWRVSCLPQIPNIGIVKMDGGEHRKLNVNGFLRYLRLEKFRSIQCIFIPCGRTKGLLVADIRRVCPTVRTIVHSKWLMINGRLEEVNEGGACHQCYRVYQHDKDFTEGVNVWVRWMRLKRVVFSTLLDLPRGSVACPSTRCQNFWS